MYVGFFVLILQGGCAEENRFDCFKGTGAQVIDHRELEPFTELKVFDNIEVEIVISPTHYVELHAGKNLLSNLKTKVEHGTLVLENNNKCNWVRSYDHELKAVVHTPYLRRIMHDGYATVRSRGTFVQDTIGLHITDAGDMDLNLESREVFLTLYETGNITLRGTTALLSFENYGLGKVYADGMTATTVFGQSIGQGDCHVRPLNFIGVNITGSGDVYYYGNPPGVERGGNGSGTLIHKP